MALVRFKRGTAERIGMTKIEDGSILIPTDKKQLYVDIGHNTRVKLVPEKLSEIDNDDNYIKGYILDELPSSGIENILYFIPNEECYYEYIYKNNQWYQVGSDVEIDEHYDATSENAQSGKAVAEAISTKQDLIDSNHKLPYSLLSGTPTIDQNYNPNSTNAQSGTAVAAAVNKLFINVLDHGVVGDGVTDDTVALQNIINGIPTGTTATIYLPNKTYKITSTINLVYDSSGSPIRSFHNCQFICDGAIKYQPSVGSESTCAIRSSGHGQTIKIRKIYVASGNGLEITTPKVKNDDQTHQTYNNIYEVGSITYINEPYNYGIYVYIPQNETNKEIFHCEFNLGEITSCNTLIRFENNGSNTHLNEHNLRLRRGGTALEGVHLRGVGSIRFHELVLENIFTYDNTFTPIDMGIAGVYLESAQECEFRNVRWNSSENHYKEPTGETDGQGNPIYIEHKTPGIVFAGNSGENYFYHNYGLANISIDNSFYNDKYDNNNYIYQNPYINYEQSGCAKWAMISTKCGITYAPLHHKYLAFADYQGGGIYSEPHYPKYNNENDKFLIDNNYDNNFILATQLKLHAPSVWKKTVFIGSAYSHFGRSAYAGQPLVLIFGELTPYYIKDLSGNTIIDNSSGKFNNKTIILRCVEKYGSSQQPQYVWDITLDRAIDNYVTRAVNDLVNYYLKSETYTKTEVNSLISAISSMSFEVVQTLPVSDIKTDVIYLVPKSTAQSQNVYDEYIYVNNAWEKIGDTQIDLSGYAEKAVEGSAGFLAVLKADGNYQSSGYTPDNFVIRLSGSDMSASAEQYYGKTVQCSYGYQDYVTGYFYKSVLDGPNYVWQRVDVQPHQSLSGYEQTTNKVTSLSSSSTDTQYPSAKCVYDLVGDVESALILLRGGNAS